MNASGCKLEFWLDYLLCICAFITLDMCMHPALGWGWSPANEREQRVSNGVIPHNYPQPWKRSSMAVWTADRTGEKGSQPANPASQPSQPYPLPRRLQGQHSPASFVRPVQDMSYYTRSLEE